MALGKINVAQQADIGSERNTHPVLRFCGEVVNFFEIPVKRAILAVKAAILTNDFGTRIHIGHPSIPVHNHRIALLDNGSVLHPNNGWNFKGLRQNRGM